MADSLSGFLDELDRAGELARIREPVRVHLEMSEISDRVMKQPGGGKALLFQKPILNDGSVSAFPVAINTFGSWKRMAMALAVDDIEEHASRIAAMVKPDVPKGLWAKMKMPPKSPDLAKAPPREYKGKPPCQEVIIDGDAVDLGKIPV